MQLSLRFLEILPADKRSVRHNQQRMFICMVRCYDPQLTKRTPRVFNVVFLSTEHQQDRLRQGFHFYCSNFGKTAPGQRFCNFIERQQRILGVATLNRHSWHPWWTHIVYILAWNSAVENSVRNKNCRCRSKHDRFLSLFSSSAATGSHKMLHCQ